MIMEALTSLQEFVFLYIGIFVAIFHSPQYPRDTESEFWCAYIGVIGARMMVFLCFLSHLFH